jgi:hypothetical protein
LSRALVVSAIAGGDPARRSRATRARRRGAGCFSRRRLLRDHLFAFVMSFGPDIHAMGRR